MTNDENPRCRVWNSVALEKNYLFYCQSKTCDAVYWKINKTLKKDLKDDKIKKLIFLIESGVPINQKKGHYVYKIRLRGELNSIYVGMTGLHPHERYLNHIIGYKASSRAKKFATALISFEGPMPYETAKMYEPQLADELREKGFNIHGGH